MPDLECVTEADLRAFQLGEVSAQMATVISKHLEICPECAALADRLDTVVDSCIMHLCHAVGPATLSQGPSLHTQSLSGAGSVVNGDTDAGLPRFFGKYELQEQLGQGGMGIVYLAAQKHPARLVALKMILAGVHAGRERRARFLAEADAIGRLQHPNVVQIYEVGECDGQLFLSLEYVAGGNLAKHLSGKALDPLASAALVEKLARAVQYAHENGVVHRDLKPSNVLLQSHGSEPLHSAPKIVDFGLAKQDEVKLTATNALLGTPTYMAPEQATGDSQQVGPAADIYALGAILYEMLTGQPPFRAANALETLEQVRTTEPPPARSRNAGVPLDLSTICAKCMQKEPNRRYATSLELAEDLGRFLAGESIRARPVGTMERVWRWCRRNPSWAATLAAVALLVLSGTAGLSLLSVNLHSALNNAERETRHAQQAERQATDQLWEAYFAQAQASRLSGRVGQHFASLQAIRKAMRLPTPAGRSLAELRTEAIAGMVLPDLDMAGASNAQSYWHSWQRNPLPERSLHYEQNGDISIRRYKDDVDIFQLPNKGPLSWCTVSLSPDGRFVQQRTGRGQFLWDVSGARPVLKVEIKPALHEHLVAFSPDSKRVVFVAADGKAMLIYATESGQLMQTLDAGLVPERMAFHPTRKELAVSGGGLVRFLDLDTGTRRKVELRHNNSVYSIAWHPGGNILATGCNDLAIRFWNVNTGALARQALAGHQSEGIVLAFSATGDHLASADWTGLSRVWDTRTGRQKLALPGFRGYFSPDDRTFVVGDADDHTRVVPFASGQGLTSWALPFADATQRLGPAYAPVGLPFFVANSSHGIFFLDWNHGDSLAQVLLPATRAFGQEGKKAILTNGPRGVLRWPIEERPDKHGLEIGPPQVLIEGGTNHFYGSNERGNILAIPRSIKGTQVWHRPNRFMTLDPRDNVSQCAVSPDGRWVVTANRNPFEGGVGATAWDAETGRADKDFHIRGNCFAGFSPDNRWLLIASDKYRLLKVGVWEEGPDLQSEVPPAWFAFAPDGKTLAVTGAIGQIRLLETCTGRELVRLTVADQTKVWPCCFSPDGVKLAAVGTESQLLYLWDLSALRIRLRELDLDWDQPAYSPAEIAKPERPRVRPDVQ